LFFSLTILCARVLFQHLTVRIHIACTFSSNLKVKNASADLPGCVAWVSKSQVTSPKIVEHSEDSNTISDWMTTFNPNHTGYLPVTMGSFYFCTCKILRHSILESGFHYQEIGFTSVYVGSSSSSQKKTLEQFVFWLGISIPCSLATIFRSWIWVPHPSPSHYLIFHLSPMLN
jgi:hypothetical protein